MITTERRGRAKKGPGKREPPQTGSWLASLDDDNERSGGDLRGFQT